MTKDLSHWRIKESLTIKQAAFLMVGEEPPDIGELEDHFTAPRLMVSDELAKAVQKGEVEAEYLETERLPASLENDEWKEIVNPDKTTIKRSHLAKWAFSKGHHPEFLRDLEENEDRDQIERQEQPFLNRKHPHFPKELEIAVSTWVALYEKGGIKEKRGHKEQIIKWINTHYEGLSNAAIERIATVVNPNKRGGAPPSVKD